MPHCQLCENELKESDKPNIGAWYCPHCRAYWRYCLEECEAMAELDGA